jgi:hypothetical protein
MSKPITPHELRTFFPNASKSAFRANLPPDDPRPAAKLESNPGDGALGPEKIQRRFGPRLLVRVTSRRKRLLDEDNLCEKYHVDLCRYAKILPSDAPGKLKIEVCQVKTVKGEPEETVIEIFESE